MRELVLDHRIAGRVAYTVNRNGTLNLPRAWVAANVGTVMIPQLKGVKTYGDQEFSGRVQWFKRGMPQLVAAFEILEELNLTNRVVFWSGSFVPRLMRGGSRPSNHTVATAFDINHQQNPFRKPIAPKGAYGSVVELLPVFRALDFECGADWSPADGMHFELKRILSASEIALRRSRILATYETTTPKPVPKPQPLAGGWTLNDAPIRSENKKGELWVPLREVTTILRHSLHHPDPESRALKAWPDKERR